MTATNIVYVLTNPFMQGLIKIGRTDRDAAIRIGELSKFAGVPAPFNIEIAVTVEKPAAAVEHALHLAFDPDRVTKGKEFFTTSVSRVKALLDVLKKEDITDSIRDEEAASTPEISLTPAGNRFVERRLNFDLVKMGIPVDARLKFYNSDAEVIVCDSKKVKFPNTTESMSLTMATRRVLGMPDDFSVAPRPYWLYGEIPLTELYEAWLERENS